MTMFEITREQEPLLRLTQEAYDVLRQFAQDDPERYLDETTDFRAVLLAHGVTSYTEPTGLYLDDLSLEMPPESGPRNRVDRQALAFYDALPGMTPAQATDPLLWAWLTHFRMHRFALCRWPRLKDVNLTDHLRQHWFVDNQRHALWRDNTASRIWWLAHTARKAAQASAGAFNAQQAVNHFASNAEHYHVLLDHSFTRSASVMAELIRSLLKDATGIHNEGLYELARQLNVMAGARYLDAVPRLQLRHEINDLLEDIMSQPKFVRDRFRLRNRTPVRVLSLGGGVQSTVLALLAARGEYGLPKPDVAVFADTGWEPAGVYDHLDWLKSELAQAYEVVTVSAGNIRENLLRGITPQGNRFLDIPAYLINPDGTPAIAARQCTAHYKLQPIFQHLRERLGLRYGRRAPKDVQVEMWLGISSDEIARAKASREEWVTNRYPLIELEFSRGQLLDWFQRHYPGRSLPRSACIGCPFRADGEWKQMQVSDPAAWADAVMVDDALRNLPAARDAITGDAYLHKKRIPLAEVIFSSTQTYDDLMAEECEGLCGI